MKNKDLFENIVQGQKDYLRIMNVTKESIKNELVLVDWASLLGDYLDDYQAYAGGKDFNEIINKKIKEILCFTEKNIS